LFLSEPEIFTEEVIVDELLDFFIAATQTTQLTTKTILSYLALAPDSMKKIRDEFASFREKLCEGKSDLSKLSPVDFLDKMFDQENAGDLEYLGYVINEALRM